MATEPEQIALPRSRTRFLVVLVDIFAVIFVIVYLTVPQEPPFAVRIRQIKNGITQEDAIRIMGCPPGDYHHPNLPKPGWHGFLEVPGTILEWTDDKHYYWIILNSDGKVYAAEIDGGFSEPSIWEKAKGWFKNIF